MSGRVRNASQAAADYAERKRQQMERAQQLKEERKANIMRVAENQIVGGGGPGSQAGVSSGSQGYGGMGYSGQYQDNGGYGQQKYGSGMNLGGPSSGGSGQYRNQQSSFQNSGGMENSMGGTPIAGSYGRGAPRNSYTGFDNQQNPGSYGGFDLGGPNGYVNTRGFGTGELKSFGYQAPQPYLGKAPSTNTGFPSKGPVRANYDMGYQEQSYNGGGGYSYANSKNSSASQGPPQYSGNGGKYSSNYDNNFNDHASKDSTTYTNSNYRKPFNPNNMQTPSSTSSMNAGLQQNGYRNQSPYQQSSYNKPPSGQGARYSNPQQQQQQQRRPAEMIDNRGPPSHSNYNRDQPPRQGSSSQKQRIPSGKGSRTYNANNARQPQPQEEVKYQPQRREAPGRSMNSGSQYQGTQQRDKGYYDDDRGNSYSKPSNNGRDNGYQGGNSSYNKQQNGYKQQPQQYKPSQPSYSNYEDEIDKQVIPALKNRAGGGFGSNLGQDAFVQKSELDLQPCPCCNRNFNPDAFEKHVKVCNKVFQQKRKEFNSQAHRIVSTEHKQILQQVKRKEDTTKQPQQRRNEDMPIRGGGGNKPSGMGKLPKWKLESEKFRNAMRAANGGGSSKGGGYGGGKGGYQPPPEEYDDRITCPHCGRKFNENAGKRHIPHCEASMKKQAMRNPAPNRRR